MTAVESLKSDPRHSAPFRDWALRLVVGAAMFLAESAEVEADMLMGSRTDCQALAGEERTLDTTLPFADHCHTSASLLARRGPRRLPGLLEILEHIHPLFLNCDRGDIVMLASDKICEHLRAMNS